MDATKTKDEDVAGKAKGKVSGKKLTGAQMAPSFKPGVDDVVVEKKPYWCGIRDYCPTDNLIVAGINFVKSAERRRPSDGKVEGVTGLIHWLTEDQVDELRAKIPRVVIRTFKSNTRHNPLDMETPPDKEWQSDKQTQAELGVPKAVRGFAITIPTKEEVEERRRNRRPLGEYVRHEGDRPAAHYLFCVPCADPKRPSRGDVMPDPLVETGL